jgi:hypothetical protein
MPSRSLTEPSGRDLADAKVIEHWRLLSVATSVDILAGFIGRRAVAEPVVAIDAKAGWARLADRWLVLGMPASHPRAAADSSGHLPNDPLPNDAEGMIAWAKRNLFDEGA